MMQVIGNVLPHSSPIHFHILRATLKTNRSWHDSKSPSASTRHSAPRLWSGVQGIASTKESEPTMCWGGMHERVKDLLFLPTLQYIIGHIICLVMCQYVDTRIIITFVRLTFTIVVILVTGLA